MNETADWPAGGKWAITEYLSKWHAIAQLYLEANGIDPSGWTQSELEKVVIPTTFLHENYSKVP